MKALFASLFGDETREREHIDTARSDIRRVFDDRYARGLVGARGAISAETYDDCLERLGSSDELVVLLYDAVSELRCVLAVPRDSSVSHNSRVPKHTRIALDSVAEKVNAIVERTEEACLRSERWSGIEHLALHQEFIRHIVYAYSYTKLFPVIFATDPFDLRVDTDIAKRIMALQELDASDVGIYGDLDECADDIERAAKHLHRMCVQVCPTDMLDELREAAKHMQAVAQHVSYEGQATTGADEFLTAVIFIAIKANPPHIHSVLRFMSHCVPPDMTRDENGYYMSVLKAALTYIVHQLKPPPDVQLT